MKRPKLIMSLYCVCHSLIYLIALYECACLCLNEKQSKSALSTNTEETDCLPFTIYFQNLTEIVLFQDQTRSSLTLNALKSL